MSTISTVRRGFSLVELLIALAIIGLLAALLFPVLTRARDRARMTACTANLHQIALALKLYSSDWDEHYPPNNADALQARKQAVWELLMPYTHNANVFHCPEERDVFDRALGYGYRSALMGTRINASERPARPGSGTVVAWCEQHTKRSGDNGWALDAEGNEIGPLIVVREDGSTGRIQASRITPWAYLNGQWQQRQSLGCPEGAICTMRFPGEEWPLEFEP